VARSREGSQAEGAEPIAHRSTAFTLVKASRRSVPGRESAASSGRMSRAKPPRWPAPPETSAPRSWRARTSADDCSGRRVTTMRRPASGPWGVPPSMRHQLPRPRATRSAARARPSPRARTPCGLRERARSRRSDRRRPRVAALLVRPGVGSERTLQPPPRAARKARSAVTPGGWRVIEHRDRRLDDLVVGPDLQRDRPARARKEMVRVQDLRHLVLPPQADEPARASRIAP